MFKQINETSKKILNLLNSLYLLLKIRSEYLKNNRHHSF